MDKDDRPLTHGAAFFAKSLTIRNGWKIVLKMPRLSSFKALTNQYSGKVVAGLVALACARSGMIMAGGVVDLPKGERVDFAKVSATRAFVQLLLWYEYYDIVCQYIINFDKRMLDFPGAPVFPKTHHLIGAYHLPGHVKPECKTKHNGHFVPGTGHTDGEDFERVWSVQNAIARSTREMGPGHRHDALNVHMADYNAQKVFKQASLAVKRYKRIQERFESDRANLEGMERSLTEFGAPLEDWRKQERAWLKKVNDPNWRREDITNPYEPQEDKKQALAELNRENERDRAANGTTSEPTHRLGRLMKFAMDIEQKQGKIHAQLSEYKAKKSDSVYNEIELLRQRLADDVQEWEAVYEDSLGQIVEELDMLPRFATTTWPAMASLQRCDPEDVSLPVPSQYPSSVRCCAEFAKAIRTERVLREGHANDLIRDIKKKFRYAWVYLAID
ncbi:hypothetical protein EWM64_g2074 [Hericium alpestre]|uniref:Uncharacterized protein n=1 Tax=Hericium alpestre TaxID=135208 RepID=A0A4Z0A4H1_9AGAM|nr:hypothetical protein EWM64_g2074 [Hericium alpestre]